MVTKVRGASSQDFQSRDDMKAYDAPVGAVLYLNEGGRSGEGTVKAGTPPSDPQEGVYIVLSNGKYWERRFSGLVHAEWFGYVADYDPTTETGTDNQAAYQAFCAFVNDNNLAGKLPGGEALTTGGYTFTEPFSLEGESTTKIWCRGNFLALGISLDFTNFESANLRRIQYINEAGFGAPEGRGAYWEGITRSHFEDLEFKHFATGIEIDGQFFTNVLTRVTTDDCTIGLNNLATALSLNNNQFNNCRFTGISRGSWWQIQAIANQFNACDLSSINSDGAGRYMHEFEDIVSGEFNACYFETNIDSVPNYVRFNSLDSANGNVALNSCWFRGVNAPNPRAGDAITVDGFVNLHIINPWFNDFDNCMVLNGSGNHFISGQKTSVINNVVDRSSFTGTYTEFRSGNISVFEGSGGAAAISINTAGKIDLGSTKIQKAAGSPAGAVGGNTADVYLRTDAGAERSDTLWVRSGAPDGTSSGWERYFPFKAGPTAERPASSGLFSSDIGICYFDRDLLKPIYYVGSNSATGWKDATGSDV